MERLEEAGEEAGYEALRNGEEITISNARIPEEVMSPVVCSYPLLLGGPECGGVGQGGVMRRRCSRGMGYGTWITWVMFGGFEAVQPNFIAP